MELILCAIHDQGVDAFMPVFQVRAQGQAIRAFQDAVNNKDDQMGQHPEHYSLWIIGYFDDYHGTIRGTGEGDGRPKKIASGPQLRLAQ